MMTLREAFCPNCLDYTQCVVENGNKLYEVKDEKIEIVGKFLHCNSCDTIIPNSELDNENFNLVYREYRNRKNLLQPSEIIEVREQYGLSQRQMAKLLGWSHATLSRYESGAIQSASHNNEVVLLKDPRNMLMILERNSSNLTEPEVIKIKKRIEDLLETNKKVYLFSMMEKVFTKKPDILNGFRTFNVDRFLHTIKFFAQKDTRLFKVKLMKYLWYTDFLHFKRWTISLNGLQYVHLRMGPVPQDHEVLLTLLLSYEEHIIKEYVEFQYGNPGELFVAIGEFNSSIFTEDELKTLQDVFESLNTHTSTSVSDLSHEERGWLETKNGEYISYTFAKDLSLN